MKTTGCSSTDTSASCFSSSGCRGKRRRRKREQPTYSPTREGKGTAAGWFGLSSTREQPPVNSPYASGRSFVHARGEKHPQQAMLPSRQRPAPSLTLPVLNMTRAPKGEQREAHGSAEGCKNPSEASIDDLVERVLEPLPLPFGGNSGGGAPPTTVGPDSPRSVNSTNSFETLASDVGEICSLSSECDGSSFFQQAAGDDAIIGGSDRTAATGAVPAATEIAGNEIGQGMGGLGVVDRTLCESWKELPWQARLCPRAIEEQEDVRRACALETEVASVSHTSARNVCVACRLASFVVAVQNRPGQCLDMCCSERSGR